MVICNFDCALPESGGDILVVDLNAHLLDDGSFMAAKKLTGRALNLGDLFLVLNSREAIAQVCHHKVGDIFLCEKSPLVHPFAEKE